MADPIGATITLDISDVKRSLTEANRLIKENEANWRVNASAMGDWTQSEKGLSERMRFLSKTIEQQEKNVEGLSKAKDEAIKKYGAESREVQDLNSKIITQSKNLERSRKEYTQLTRAVEKMTAETDDANEEIEDTTKESKKASKALDTLEDSAKDAGEGFTIAKGAIASFIGTSLTALVAMAGQAVSSLMGLTESTLEYRREMARVTTVAEQVGVSGDRIIDKWMDMNAVIQDDSSVTEGLNNLMTAGFTAEKEMDAITKALEGASIQWAETLKFEGLSDSLQEWIGSDGASLTGQFAELLERLGYNLEDVTEQTKGMTDAQRRNWAIQTLNKEGLSDVSDAYREANKEMIAYNKANADLLHAQSQLGEEMQPFVTIVKQSTADIIYSFIDMVNGVEGAGDQLLYNVGYLAGQIYSNVKSFLSTFIPVIADAIPDIIQTIQDALPEFIAQGMAMINSLIDGAGQMMPQLMSDTTTMLLDIINKIGEYAPELLASALNFFGQIVSAIPTTITQIGEKMPEIIDTVTGKLFEGENSLFNSAITFLGKIVDAIPDIIERLSVEFPKIIDKISQSLTDAMPTILQGAKDLLHKIVEAIPDIIDNLGESLPDIINKILQFLVDNAPAILEGAKDMLLEIVNAIPTVVASLGTALWDILSEITDFFIDNAGEIWDIGVDIVQGIIDGIKSMLNSVKEVGKWLYDKTIGAVLGFFGINSPSTEMRDKVGKNIVSGMVEGIKSMLSSITDGTKWIYDNTIGKIKGFFADNSLSDIGSNIVSGITGGIKKMGSAISEATSWIADNTIGKLKGWLGIASPSKIAEEEVGKYLAEGIAVGIKDGIYYIADSIEELADNGITQITSASEVMGEGFGSGFIDGLNGTEKTITKAVEEAVEEATEEIDASGAGKKVATAVGDAVKEATTDYSKYVDASVSLASILKEGNTEDSPTAIADELFGMAGQFGGAWGALADSIWSFIADNLFNKSNEEIAETAQLMVNNLMDTILSLMTNLPQIIEGGITFLKEFAKGLIRGIPEIIRQLPEIISGMVETFISEGIPALFEVGVELIQGLIEGMFSVNILDVIGSIGKGIVNGFKKLFGIRSPSKVMADEVGKNLALGMEEGLTENLGGLNKAIRTGVDTSLKVDGIQRKQVNVYQTNHYSQAHSRYELYKSKHDTANAVKLALQGV